jgi:hypothetical protein
MAITPSSLSLLVLATEYKGDVVKQYNTATPFLSRIRQLPIGDKDYGWVAKSSGKLVSEIAEGADLVNAAPDKRTAAVLKFKDYTAGMAVTDKSALAATFVSSPLSEQQQWVAEMSDALDQLSLRIDLHCYTGDGVLQITGLDQAIGSTTNTYAGIDRTVVGNEYWHPGALENAGAAALTVDMVKADKTKIFSASGYEPDLAFVHPNVYDQLGADFEASKQYVRPTVSLADAAQQFAMVGGNGLLMVDGTIFVRDHQCPDKAVYYVNSRFVDLIHMDTTPSLRTIPGYSLIASQMAMMGSPMVQMPFGAIPELLAKTGSTTKGQMLCWPELVVRRPNSCGKRFNLA